MSVDKNGDFINKVEQNFNIDRAALGNKAEQLLEKAVEKKKVGMFRGIQTRVMTAMIVTMIVSAGLAIGMAIDQSSKALTERVKGDMLTLVESYGINLETAADTANLAGNELPEAKGLVDMFGSIKLEGMDSSYIYIVDSNGTMPWEQSIDLLSSASGRR